MITPIIKWLIAQLGEQQTFNLQGVGSIPTQPTNIPICHVLNIRFARKPICARIKPGSFAERIVNG
jgi:hypothetical protein